ncbi:MAG TPA: glycosyl hydrolase family 79 C-terminal domain-containing protein [Solirubrobacteraceae bacterium]
MTNPPRGLAAAVISAVALVVGAGTSYDAVARASVFRVSVTRQPASRPIKPGFLGLALEYRSIPALTGTTPKTVNPVLVGLIRNLVGNGRPVLRIGGQSGDRTWWPIAGMRRPIGITYDLTPRWMASAHALAQAAGARLILGVGLEANRPRIDAVEAGQLLKGLGRRYIDALEIGNEPELYPLIPWFLNLHGKAVPWYSHFGVPVYSRRTTYGPGAFAQEFSRTLQVLPRIPIAGPDTGIVSWLGGFRGFVGPGSRVRILTWHAYGLNQCVMVASSPLYPTVSNLLRPQASRAVVNGISPYVALAHRFGASFRVDEMNSVTCNGRLGVSNTFASALWVMDSLFTIASRGVDGVNIHTFQNAANGLFDFHRSRGHWQGTVHPLYYGVLMFARAAPPGSRVLRIHAANQSQIRVWATIGADHRVRVLLINTSTGRSTQTLVRAPGRSGSVVRLRASSAYATGRVTLGGQRFAPRTESGALAPPRTEVANARGGAYSVRLPAASAALLTIPAD